MSKKRWKELEQCEDFNILRERFSDDMLDYFEEAITAYLNDEINYEDADYICYWYEGSIDTEDLLDSYYDCD